MGVGVGEREGGSEWVSLYAPISPPYSYSATIPSHAVLPVFSLNPGTQLWHILAPSTAHAAPDGGTPLAHEQALASHLRLSVLTFHPALHVDTKQADVYVAACGTAQAGDTRDTCMRTPSQSFLRFMYVYIDL